MLTLIVYHWPLSITLAVPAACTVLSAILPAAAPLIARLSVNCSCTVCPCSIKTQLFVLGGCGAVAAAETSCCTDCCCCCCCCCSSVPLDAAEACEAAVTRTAAGSRGSAMSRTQTDRTVGHSEHHTTSVSSNNQSLWHSAVQCFSCNCFCCCCR
jgi:hypothetical protein